MDISLEIITLDPIQQIFHDQPELIELFAKHDDERADVWSGEIDPTGEFSYVIYYEYDVMGKIARKLYFKYIPVIRYDYRTVVEKLESKAFSLSNLTTGVIYVYGENKVHQRTDESLLYDDWDEYECGIHSIKLFNVFIDKIRQEKIDRDNYDATITKQKQIKDDRDSWEIPRLRRIEIPTYGEHLENARKSFLKYLKNQTISSQPIPEGTDIKCGLVRKSESIIKQNGEAE